MLNRKHNKQDEQQTLVSRRSTRVRRLRHSKEQEKEKRSLANEALFDQLLLLAIDCCIFLSAFYVVVTLGVMGTARIDSTDVCKYFIQFAFSLLVSFFMHYCINESLKEKNFIAWDANIKLETLEKLIELFKDYIK